MLDTHSKTFCSPSMTGKNMDIESSSPLQMSTLIQVTLPHSLTSSQGQSEDQFLVKSPAPPLASAPVGILGSWPLPPPPGQCWYGYGYERLLVGQLEGISREPLLFSGCYIQKTLNNNICCYVLNPKTFLDLGNTIGNSKNSNCENEQL